MYCTLIKLTRFGVTCKLLLKEGHKHEAMFVWNVYFKKKNLFLPIRLNEIQSYRAMTNEELYNYRTLFTRCGTAVAQWLRCCATNQTVAGSIPAGVIGIFHCHKMLPIALRPWGRLSLLHK